MADFVDAFRLSWAPELANLSRPPEDGGMHAWLASGTYAISTTTNADIISIDNIDKQHYLACLAFDINRLASAGRETLLNIQEHPQMPRATAWPLVMMYYAALFHAHVLLRMWGMSPSYLTTNELLKLRRVSTAYGVTAKFKTGSYLLNSELNNSKVSFSEESNGDGGGSHNVVWKRLEKALKTNIDLLPSSFITTPEQSLIEKDIKLIISAVNKAGSKSAWLSTTRNSIQYRQEFGVWFPHSSKLTTAKLIERTRNVLNGNVDIKDFDTLNSSEPVAFYESCLLVIYAVRSSIYDMTSIKKDSSFLRLGMSRIEKTII